MPAEDEIYQYSTPSDHIEEASFTSRNGERYWILHHPQNRTYIRLNENEYQAWKRIREGKTQINLNSNLHEQSLLTSLHDEGFLQAGDHENQQAGNKGRDENWISHYWELCIPLPGMHILFDTVDRKIGRVLRSWWFPWIFTLVCLFGLTYFLITEPLPSYPVLQGEDSQLITVLSVYVILITAAILHVFGHALACKVYGREIGDAGLLLYYGMPCLYIDTSDIWMADRRSRIIVSLAGPAVNLFIGSICAILVMGFPDSDASSLLWRVAFLSFAVALINLNPLLEFDGYYALADLLEVPDLRERAFSFVRTWGSNRIRLSREGWFFLMYGTASAVCTLAIVVFGIYFWTEHMTDLITELGKDRWEMDHILATFAIVIVFVPFFAGMIISGTKTLMQKIGNPSGNGDNGVLQSEQVHEKRVLTRRISK